MESIVEFFNAAPGRIAEGNGLAISLAGMAIVFVSLAFISLFIASLPRILKLAGLVSDDGGSVRSHVPDEQIVAAIGAVLHSRAQGKDQSV